MTRALQIICFAAVAMLPLGALAQASHPLTNDDVKKLVKNGFSEDVIVAMVEANDSVFDVSMDGLTSLKDAGISNPVIQAMLKAEARKRQSGPAPVPAVTPQPVPAPPAMPVMPPGVPAMPAGMQQMMSMAMGMMGGGAGGGMMGDPSQLPPLNLVNNGNPQAVKASIAQVASTQTKGDGMPGAGSEATSMLMGLGRQALSFGAIGSSMFAGPAAGMAIGLMGGMGGMGRHHGPPKVTYVWALPGPQSPFTVTDPKPHFAMSYGNLLGIDPDAYEPQLIRLVGSRDNWRLVGATKTAMGQLGTEAWEKVTEARIAVTTEKLARGQVQIIPKQPLEPGEYAVVLRAIHPGKRSEGSLGGGMEANIFFAVWDFSVGNQVAHP
ncbi:MAG TPA: hypothetical protein VGJ21_25430 [Terracidiphilus sp.]